MTENTKHSGLNYAFPSVAQTNEISTNNQMNELEKLKQSAYFLIYIALQHTYLSKPSITFIILHY